MAFKISLQGNMDFNSILACTPVDFDPIQELGTNYAQVELFIDLRHVTFATPSGIAGIFELIKGSGAQQYAVRRPDLRDPFQYSQRMGLFDNLNIFNQQNFNAHPAGNRFKELTIISCDHQPRSTDVDDLCRGVVDVISPDDRELQDILLFCIGEMINNVIQHSGSTGSVCAQYYQRSDQVEVAIVDHGIGLRTALLENPEYSWLRTDIDAINLALQPDTSGTFNRPNVLYGASVNTGNGLYYLKNIIALSLGYLDIWSGEAYYHQDGNNQSVLRPARNFNGTLVSFRIMRGMAPSLQEQLATIRGRRNALPVDDDIQFG